MKHALLNSILPPQKEGREMNTESHARFRTPQEARDFYQVARRRLLNVNEWQTYAGGGASFQLIDEHGDHVSRDARKGDFFQIDIPGPGSRTGDGKDWVQIQHINERQEGNMQIVYFTVRSSPHPLQLEQGTAHFFGPSATSTFAVYRDNALVTAGVYGRNERPNVKNTNTMEKLRNLLVALGAMLGVSKLQWKALTSGLVKK